MAADKAVVITNAEVLDGSQLKAALDQTGVSLEATSIVTSSSVPKLGQGVYSAIVSLSQISSHHTVPLLGQLCSALRPGGMLLVEEPQGATPLEKTLLLAGFTDIAGSAASIAAAPGTMSTCTARKPDWETGASSALPRSSKLRLAGPVAATAPPQQQQQRPQASALWTMAAEDDEELLDDNELLTEEDLKRPEVPTLSDCETGATKKACANCTCGRAEAEVAGVKAELTPEMLENPQSACGSCGLGDAFRCSTCPYRGLPKFETGQKVQLPSDFLTADA